MPSSTLLVNIMLGLLEENTSLCLDDTNDREQLARHLVRDLRGTTGTRLVQHLLDEAVEQHPSNIKGEKEPCLLGQFESLNQEFLTQLHDAHPGYTFRMEGPFILLKDKLYKIEHGPYWAHQVESVLAQLTN